MKPGDVFGLWTVIGVAYPMAACRCACGTLADVTTSNLYGKRSTRCVGCSSAGKANPLTGIGAKLTDRQRTVLAAIHQATEERGAPPSHRELGKLTGIRSTNGVADHLRALRRKGVLEPVQAGAVTVRMLRLTGMGLDLLGATSTRRDLVRACLDALHRSPLGAP